MPSTPGSDLTTALDETEARRAELTTARTVSAEQSTAFNQHPGQEFRARELHEPLGMPTDEASGRVPFAFHSSWADHQTLDSAIATHRDARQ